MHDLLDDLAFPLFSWTATPKPRFVRVVPEEITGRRSTSYSAAQCRRLSGNGWPMPYASGPGHAAGALQPLPGRAARRGAAE
jgi:hypothetical protein